MQLQYLVIIVYGYKMWYCVHIFLKSLVTKCFGGIKSLIFCTTDSILPQVHNYEK